MTPPTAPAADVEARAARDAVQAREAEEQLLGACIHAGFVPTAAAAVSMTDFSSGARAMLWKLLADLTAANVPFDATSLLHADGLDVRLRAAGIDRDEARDLIRGCWDSVVGPNVTDAYAKSVREHAARRRVQRAVHHAAAMLAEDAPAADVLAHLDEVRRREAEAVPAAPAAWGWTAPDALLAEPEADVPWFVRSLLAPGHVTLLSASPKAGKTTTVTRGILGPLSRGEPPFCGTVPEAPVTALWLTEESRRGARRHVRYGGIRGGEILPRPGPPRSVPWPDVVAQAADHAAEIGARILVVDPFASHARLGGDDENSSSAVGAAMEPLVRVSATHDLAVLVIHHVKKWSASGDPSSVDLARGSGAFGAVVDFFANLVKPSAPKPGQERHRELYGAGRDDVEPYKLTLDLVRGDGVTTFDRYRVVGVDEVAADPALEADILGLVRESVADGGMTRDQLVTATEKRRGDVVAALGRMTQGTPPRLVRGLPAKGSRAPRYLPWRPPSA